MGTTIHQIRVTLVGLKPPIWRRFTIPSDFDLNLLHEVLQGVMGWKDCHLHFFEVGTQKYSSLALIDNDLWDPMEEECRVTLAELKLAKGSQFNYVYDLGDYWLHEVEVEDVRAADPHKPLMACLDGARACPPEDCGGLPGYEALLQALQDPTAAQHLDLAHWIDQGFDPEYFDADERTQAMLGAHVGTDDEDEIPGD